jgi:hypothetical protein
MRRWPKFQTSTLLRDLFFCHVYNCLGVCVKDSSLTRIMTLESFGGDLKVFLLRVRVSLPQAT